MQPTHEAYHPPDTVEGMIHVAYHSMEVAQGSGCLASTWISSLQVKDIQHEINCHQSPNSESKSALGGLKVDQDFLILTLLHSNGVLAILIEKGLNIMMSLKLNMPQSVQLFLWV